MRPGDTITSQATGRTITVLGVRQEVTWDQDSTYGELRVAVQTAGGKAILIVARRSGPAGLNDTQVETALANVEADLIAKAKEWVDR